MAFCSKCGMELKENDLFCPGCGIKTELKIQKDQKIIKAATTGNDILTAICGIPFTAIGAGIIFAGIIVIP